MFIDAIYKNGAFVPTQPVTFAEGASVTLNVETLPNAEMSDEEFTKRLSQCKTVEDLIEFRKSLPEDDGSYRIEEWLDESRRETGFRMPFEKVS